MTEEPSTPVPPYERPEVTVLGTVEDVTRGGATIFGDLEAMASPTTLSQS